jgi:hypothetical protein
LAKLRGDIGRNILRPPFCSVESDDASGILALPGGQVLNDCFEIGVFDVGFTPDAAVLAESTTK